MSLKVSTSCLVHLDFFSTAFYTPFFSSVRSHKVFSLSIWDPRPRSICIGHWWASNLMHVRHTSLTWSSDIMVSKDSGWLTPPPPPPPPRGTRHQDTSPIPFKGSYHSEQYLAIPTKLLWSEQFSLQEKFPSNKTCTLENVAVPPSHPTQMALSTFPKQYEHSQTSCSEETSLLTHVDYSTLDGPAKNTLLLL